MSTQRKPRKNVDISEEFFNVYHRVPDGLKVYTDPLVKTGIRTSRAMEPSMIRNRAKADAWVGKHIIGRIDSAKARVSDATNGVQRLTKRIPKRK